MKKCLYIFLCTLITMHSANAQQTNIVTGSGTDTSVYSKTDQIQSSTDDDLGFIQEAAEAWKNDIATANEDVKTTKEQLEDIISMLQSKHDEFTITETDPGVKSYTKLDMPACHGDEPRLVYKKKGKTGGEWRCDEPIPCGDIDPTQGGWIQDKTTNKCIKPEADWVIEGWSSCNSSYKQTRGVLCKYSGTTTADTACSGPKPLDKRDCAGL